MKLLISTILLLQSLLALAIELGERAHGVDRTATPADARRRHRRKALARTAHVRSVRASKPAHRCRLANCDYLVVNFHRNCHTEELIDEWGVMRRKRVCSITCWVSYWSLVALPSYPAPVFVLRDDGWTRDDQVRIIAPCSRGWACELKSGCVIVGRELWVIDSDYDWEIRNRCLYSPIR